MKMTFPTGFLVAAACCAPAIGAVSQGDPAPEWTLMNVVTPRETISLSDYVGSDVLLIFWNTRSDEAQNALEDEVKPLWELHEQSSTWAVVGIGGNQLDELPGVQRHFAMERGYTWDFVYDPADDVRNAYNVLTLPTFVWVGSSGLIEAVGGTEVVSLMREHVTGEGLTGEPASGEAP